jgi:PPK2 family polyphosphate:nucleotide phosphotransferase
MTLPPALIEELLVRPGRRAELDLRDTAETATHWFDGTGNARPRDLAEHDLARFRAELSTAQELLYAAGTRALLVIFQGPDAAGKDGTIKHVMSGVNPQGCQVTSFKEPSAEELGHDFLWRCVKALPRRGQIGIFNRSYYEDVLVPRVHPDSLPRTHLTADFVPDRQFWIDRYEAINSFERHLYREGTQIVKFFLHISKAEQRTRLLRRLDDPAKNWKFSPSDITEHGCFDDYRRAYEPAISATSTHWAPWYVVPADHKYALRALVGGILVHLIGQLDLRRPALSAAQRAALTNARRELAAE